MPASRFLSDQIQAEPDSQPVIQIFYFDAGGGHRAAATALKTVMEQRHPHYRIDMVNLQELLATVDPVSRLSKKLRSVKKSRPGKKFQSEDIYNTLLKKGWTYGSIAMLRGLQKGIKYYAPEIEETLGEHWRTSNPKLVVSMIPNFNGPMFRSLRREHPRTPYVTVMTDIADYPPHFWQEKQDQYMICGSNRAYRQACTVGYRRERIFKVSGMILRPDFYRPAVIDRREERIKAGLDPERPTALISFGGNGSKKSLKIVKYLQETGIEMQSIVMCGRNVKLLEQLQGQKNCFAVGYTDRVPEIMRMADFLIGKSGPGIISEAVRMGLPLTIVRNNGTMPQELYNAKWVEKRKVGIVIKNFNRKQVVKAVKTLFKGDRLEQFKSNARNLNNMAVFEVADILDRIVTQHPSLSTPVEFVDEELRRGTKLPSIVTSSMVSVRRARQLIGLR